MMRQITADEAVGKTFKGYVPADRGASLLLTFDDGTFTVFVMEPGFDLGDETIEPQTVELKALLCGSKFYADTLVNAGVVTEQELEDFRADAERSRREQAARARRAEYERLRAEFEGKLPDA